ncbi:RagB/SusD family nutrient uptake outer membrane protein [Pararcticibacter amylolyticus]|uniref:RagB/SusD family nutrient uptake outer membrane protein n=1 Tax=Pararcticibacter amylolyticus TaxID=2173175 RepID=A0A2U2PKA2_9SPHI|nr:RagB/SusD family nutrient uptake outer membrane protein [Pararcticibacter amylolyticus]PWG81833.1 hypothetical protein DDR33_05600 [Pararcticibacter amylolyticus]
MKLYNNILIRARAIITCLVIVSLSSCEKFLDVVPSELVTDDQVWGNINNANGVLANLYSQIQGVLDVNGYTDEITAATDETFHHWGAGYYPLYYNNGAWHAANNPYDNWDASYQKIRKANLFLENIDKVPVAGEQASFYATVIPRYKAEARFLRSLFYFELLRRYGGVPIITQSYEAAEADQLRIPRASVDEVVNFIVSECEEISETLPVSYEDANLGRVTKGAALALAARTLTYAASPLFNGNTLYASVKNPDGGAIFSQSYDKEKWKRAADAAKKVIDLNIYHLNTINGDPVNSYARVFNTRNWTEVIFARVIANTKNIEMELLPYGGEFGGWGKYSILEELVDSYEMNNGYPINHPNSGYQEDGFWSGDMDGIDGVSGRRIHLENISNRYKNRDPRFYASISFQGSKWATHNTNNMPIWLAWWGANGGTSQGWPKPTGTFPISGYNVRKWLDPNVDMNNYWGSPDAQRNDPVIRMAEVYLNYAEALNEYYDGPTPEAFAAVNEVRKRAGMPQLPVIAEDNTKEGFRKRIQNENRIEFAFESHRFWDVRRWLIGTQVDNGPVHGLNARPTTEELKSTGLDVNSKEAGLALFYKTVVIQTRVFQPKHYLFPIPQSEMEVNRQLVQNYGW